MNELTMNLGNAPSIPIEQIYELRGHLCAVEFQTKKLLGYGTTWEQVLIMVDKNGFGDRNFYRYKIPSRINTQICDAVNLAKEKI
ncbi:MAG: hypothetical protein SGI77_17665 [Pirellulaceae bacterium]|nr:hypothetical protein [Pirellulaceae bacterium]